MNYTKQTDSMARHRAVRAHLQVALEFAVGIIGCAAFLLLCASLG